MERKIYLREKPVIILLVLIFFVGIVGHTISQLREIMLFLTPFTLVVTSLVVFISFFHRVNKSFYYWFFITFFLTFILEAIGVKTGLVFGDYTYGSVLGPKLFSVPVIIGINWALIILGATIISASLTKNKFLLPLIAGLLSVTFDFILEPVAIALDYWDWEGGIVPTQNYISWFVIGTLSAVLYNFLKVKISDDVPKYYFIMQFLFFVALYLIL
ncbi:MAG: carotenoid biosynthesis protein [Ignavibacteria bacterium]|nr:carotenoid biosynthesis protein [Ignavibacteria bacterium]MBT8384039.1 carotenoid biosynthesis protein [Ignavibacteria bacterium]MBT8392252.1 carotenoid biosynthesis protein [Ignavibacteria bacterium]NNJ51759.1 carotenoid biosynthesis protein [Ignavibacteriaceae bacterium]NNL21797.1 carotenoid biosynthesis protein [Ignavibacteriaceae bacterium]